MTLWASWEGRTCLALSVPGAGLLGWAWHISTPGQRMKEQQKGACGGRKQVPLV